MNQEREKIQHKYEEMTQRNDQLQQQIYDIEFRNLQKLDQERILLRQEQEAKIQQHHTELIQSKEENIQLKLSISSMEKLKEMEIQMALDEGKNSEKALRLAEMKSLKDLLVKTEIELTKSNAFCTSLQNMIEITIESRVNAHIQQENAKINILQEELRQTKEMLYQLHLANEESKVEVLQHTMEMHQKEFQEIKETLMTTKHSSSGLGKIGENYFNDLAEATFGTYDRFEVLDKTKVAHCGDFHLTFHDFHILVDVKNFIKGRISTTDVSKFKFDMTRNQNIRIGWLISLQGTISNYGKRPYTFEVLDGRLLVFINDLQNVPDPVKMLQDVWHMCCFIYHQMLNTESSADVLSSYKRYEKRIKESMERLQKMSKKTIATMNQLREDVLETERFVKELINDDVALVRNEHNITVEQWWNPNIVVCEGAKVKSNCLYDHFQQQTQSVSITNDMFKVMLKALVQNDQIQCGKQAKSQYTIVGFALKTVTA